MAYTVSSLTTDILPRLIGVPKKGTSIIQAINSVQSMIFKRLLSRNSDLIAKGDLALPIAAQGYSATLPDDFVALAERLRAQEIYTDWMAGTVVSYDSASGALVVNVTDSSGADTLAQWNIATAALPDSPSTVIGSSTTSLTVSTVQKSLTVEANLDIQISDYLIIFPTSLPDTLTPLHHYLEPQYLDEDEPFHDKVWWEWYGLYGIQWEPPCIRPRHYKIIDNQLYVRPTVVIDVTIKGRYFQLPTAFTRPTDIIPYRGMFDEVFREGAIWIMANQVASPEQDKAFVGFIHREVDSVLNARIHLIRDEGRLRRGNYL